MNNLHHLSPYLKVCLAVLFSFPGLAAVHLSQSGNGEAISFPFYSVAPGINNFLTINNNTDQFKAVKVHLKESKNLTAIKSFNLYLKPEDMWTMGMVSVDEKMYVFTGDLKSCATGVKFAGFLEDSRVDLPADIDWWEWQTGTIEVIEMGEIESSLAAELFVDTTTNPCQAVNEAWSQGGRWYGDQSQGLRPATGGISGSISMIDVANGFAFSYPPLVFAGFFAPNSVNHTSPRANEPNLASGTRESLLINEGRVFHTLWPTGYEAISALLMTTHIENNFELSESIAAKTEWVISLPTLGYHKNATDTTAPFELINPTDFFSGTIKFPPNPTVYGPDAEVLSAAGDFGCTPTVPCEFSKSAAVNTFSLIVRDDVSPESSILAGFYQFREGYAARENHEIIQIGNTQSAEIGKISFSFYDQNESSFQPSSSSNNRGRDAVTNQPQVYYGLPAVGFSFSRYTNANAQPGQLAVYGKSHQHSGKIKIDVVTEQ